MKYIKNLNLNTNNWLYYDYDDDIIDIRDLYGALIRCKKSYKNFIVGKNYKINKVYGDPESSYRAGQKYMGVEYVSYVEIEGTNFLFNKKFNFRYPYFFEYFEI